MTLPLNVPVDAMIEPTVIFGVPVRPCAFTAKVEFDAVPVTSPVKLPIKVVAVVVPDTFTFCRRLHLYLYEYYPLLQYQSVVIHYQ